MFKNTSLSLPKSGSMVEGLGTAISYGTQQDQPQYAKHIASA